MELWPLWETETDMGNVPRRVMGVVRAPRMGVVALLPPGSVMVRGA
ncbi:hypothetical protein JCM3263A_10260 [Thermobifida fusca]